MDKFEQNQKNRIVAEQRGKEALSKIQAEKDKKELDNEMRKI